MKKIIIAVVIALGFITLSNYADAQGKMGYMSVEQMVGLMPDIHKIDTLLQKYQADSVNATFAVIVQDYNFKDSMLNKTDTTKLPPSVKAQYRRDLESDAYQIKTGTHLLSRQFKISKKNF